MKVKKIKFLNLSWRRGSMDIADTDQMFVGSSPARCQFCDSVSAVCMFRMYR
jgi:hypothetical protein